ncbi:MAG: hypothetical protein RLZZ245_2238 [Verrucomicrobiota bacterium]|jgi:hypothetical protein
MHIFVTLGLMAAATACAAPSAKFDGTDLVIRDGATAMCIPEILDPHAFYGTVHAVQRRGADWFVVYGSSEMSRGWPPKSGYCGCGIESYIRWIHVRRGAIIRQQEGRQESCIQSRDGWAIEWLQGKLVWITEGPEREGDPPTGERLWFTFRWSFDPANPEIGILETRTPVP